MTLARILTTGWLEQEVGMDPGKPAVVPESSTTRRQAISGALAVLLSDLTPVASARAGAQSPSAQGSSPRPNIIVILADDLGYADVSLYQGGRFPTPHLEKLAERGVLFTEGYASAPVCAPSRAGLMTGRYQERFGFEYNNGPAQRDVSLGLGLNAAELTIAQLLERIGYYTGVIGKWHLGSDEPFYPTNRGYDEFVGFLPGETSYIDPRLPGVHLSYGPLGDDLLAKHPKLARQFVRHSLNEIIEGPDRKVVHNEDQYLTDYLAARAVEFIERRSKAGRPYFLYVPFNAVHSPHMVTERYYSRFPNIHDHQLHVYAAMIASLDDAVGRIMAAVDASGATRDTMVYFASDNGCEMYFPGLCSCSPLRGGKLSDYEGGTRVPFILSWPRRLPEGAVYPAPVSLLDVLPTSVAAAGGRLPTDRTFDGVDLLPYLTGDRPGNPHDELFWRRQPLFAIRKGDWKLWESNDASGVYGNYKLLFNLKDDPNETTNVAASHPEKVRELEALFHQWSADMAAPKWTSRPPQTFKVCGKTFTLPI